MEFWKEWEEGRRAGEEGVWLVSRLEEKENPTERASFDRFLVERILS